MTAVAQAPATSLSQADAARLARERFGIEARAVLLRSEREQTFHLTGAAGEHVLKIAHPDDDPAVAAFQSAALQHIAEADPTLPTPRVVPPRAGPDDGRVRLLTWLPGLMLHAAPPSPAQRRHLGYTHGRLSVALIGFTHRAASRNLRWDLKRADRIADLLEAVPDTGRRTLAEQAFKAFAALKPSLLAQRAQVIHNDLNPHNVVVDPLQPARIAGILDFGDMIAAPLVCDVAVAAAYQFGEGVEGAAQYVAGYHAASPLSRQEIAMLPALAATRMAMTVAITEWRAARHPDNRDYIMRNHPSAVAGLKLLAGAGAARAAEAMRAACEEEGPLCR